MSEELEITNLTPAEETPPISLIEAPKVEETPVEFVPLASTDLTFADGFEVNEELRDEFLKVVNDQEMTPKDRAQALVELQQKAATTAAEASSRVFEDQQKQWQDEVKKDAEIGGANLQKTLDGISRLVTKYGSEELIQVMAATGAGNNIHVIRMLAKMSADLNEGGPITGNPAGETESRAARLYPTMKG